MIDASVLAFKDASLAAVLSAFLGSNVSVAAGSFLADDSPYQEERQLVLNAVATRRAEFFSGRYYARKALGRMGYQSVPILRGEKGNPLWPTGVLGSITHDLNQVVVATTAAGSNRGFGIDLVLNPARIEASLQSLIVRDGELDAMEKCCENLPGLALAFSLKESVVKAVSPGIDHYLDLLDIELAVTDNKISAYLAGLDIHVECGFVAVQNGLLSFARLGRE